MKLLLMVMGSLFFLWFFLPALLKGMWNFGSVCGMLFSAAAVCYGVFFCRVNGFVRSLWRSGGAGRAALCVPAVCFAAGLALAAAASVSIIRANSSDIPENTPAVLLGCSVKGERPSRVLTERIGAAYRYLTENPGAVCILSGGRGPGEDITEAECMYCELVKKGIAPERLYREAESVNTEENLRNSSAILTELGVDTADALVVISSDFHVYRGCRYAEQMGYDAYGYGSRTDWFYLPTFFLREVIAVVRLWVLPF